MVMVTDQRRPQTAAAAGSAAGAEALQGGMTVGENLLPQTAKDATLGFLRWIAKIAMAAFSPERRKPEQAAADFGQMPGNVIVGRNPVTEALKSGREMR